MRRFSLLPTTVEEEDDHHPMITRWSRGCRRGSKSRWCPQIWLHSPPNIGKSPAAIILASQSGCADDSLRQQRGKESGVQGGGGGKGCWVQ
jgi:hypothetical protein